MRTSRIVFPVVFSTVPLKALAVESYDSIRCTPD